MAIMLHALAGLLYLTVFFEAAEVTASVARRADVAEEKMHFEDKFRQLDELLPTPNEYRTGSGAPGYRYWQQQVDYDMSIKLDTAKQRLHGDELITYTNRSPDSLPYLWFHIESMSRDVRSDSILTQTGLDEPKLSYGNLRRMLGQESFQLDYRIESVTDGEGRPLDFVINRTTMRVDLRRPLAPTRSQKLRIKWSFNLHDQDVLGGRSGYEFFEKKNNYIYQVSIFYPRLAAYTDVGGWHNKPFLGGGEFTLEFGNYDVAITVPSNHVVAATGELQNAAEVLSREQRNRLAKAASSDKPIYIVTPEEAQANELKSESPKTHTWRFQAKSVRDFAFATSPKFIWDAQGVQSGDQSVLAMSYYPEEATPLWEKYSTHAIVHTIEEYNRYTFDYPYPTAISVNGPVGGMEYPMISFNGPRPEIDEKTGQRTYSRRTKYGLISVIIHEVGHNYFPMIVNSDERQWTWMDEGVNTFVQFLAEQSWEPNYPSRRGDARNIIDYMASANQVPIMTNSESLWQFGNNAYGKPATALNILRETILGRELFDFAFQQYAQRWKFKRPMPADFFRTMEDASGVDLDWFWRGWFYSTDHVDISLDTIHHFTINTGNQEIEQRIARQKRQEEPDSITKQRNRTLATRADRFPELLDFYNQYDEFTVTGKDRKSFEEMMAGLKPEEKQLLQTKKNFYQLEFSNLGGLVMPIILQLGFSNGQEQMLRIPAEIWRRNSNQVSKVILSDHELLTVVVDPYWETADVDTYNNHYPRKPFESRLQVFKREKSRNLMREMVETKKPVDEAQTETKALDSALPSDKEEKAVETH